MRRFLTVFTAAALLIGAACSGGDKNSGGDNAPDSTEKLNEDGVAQKLFQPAGVVGPDSFAPSFELSAYSVTDEEPVLDGSVSASTPGIYRGRTYGGTGGNICDVEKMIEFLTFYEDRGRAWADVQGISFEEMPAFIRGLTPVYVTQDVNVTMYGFKDGAAYGYDAIIGAGTAVLIDEQGMPRARCACGNPLASPGEQPADTTVPGESSVAPPVSANETPTTEPETTTTTEPQQKREPECPTLDDNGQWTDYVTTDGTVWTFVAGTGWVNFDTDPPTVFESIRDIKGFDSQCPPPSTPCPEEYEGAQYTDSTGQTWVWVGSSAGGANWWYVDSEGGFHYSTTADLPGVPSDCAPPITERTPGIECPSVYEGATWVDVNGDEWVWVSSSSTGAHWWRNVDGVDVYASTDQLPGVPVDCPEPVECPPNKPRIGQTWVDAEGNLWIYNYGPNKYPSWDNVATTDVNEDVDTFELPGFSDCYPPTSNPCPPEQATPGTTWSASDGTKWVLRTDIAGRLTWDRVDTDEVEMVATGDLPGSDDCGDPTDDPCPSWVPVNGETWITPEGVVYIYSAADGVWINPQDSGDRIATNVALPGFTEECMPPCPPLQLSAEEEGLWVNPATGVFWSWTGEKWESDIGAEVRETRDLPWYRTLCLPPCSEDSTEGEPNLSWIEDDNGNPITNTDVQLNAGMRSAITITPAAPVISKATSMHVLVSTAPFDDCNDQGCVAEGAEPDLGHQFTDVNGVVWTYGGDGLWHSEMGDSTTSQWSIPGYKDACIPADEDTPDQTTTTTAPSISDGPCPPEYEGSTYTNSDGLTFVWVGGNRRSEGSTHEALWFRSNDDGSVEYRYSRDLESDGRFAGCPTDQNPPAGWKIGHDCVDGQTVIFVHVWSPTGSPIVELSAVNGNALEMEVVAVDADSGIYSVIVTEEALKSNIVSLVAIDTDGEMYSLTVPLAAAQEACGADAMPNLAEEAPGSNSLPATTSTSAPKSTPKVSLPTLDLGLPFITIPTPSIPRITIPVISVPGVVTTTVAPTGSTTTRAPSLTLAPIVPTLAPIRIPTTTMPRVTTTTRAPSLTIAPTLAPIRIPTTTTTVPRTTTTIRPLITLAPIRIPTTTVKKP